MSANNRICPNCRSPLPTNTCKRCGFKQKTLNIVETQQEFGKVNLSGRVHTSHAHSRSTVTLTAHQKLMVYLKSYQQLLKSTAERVARAAELTQKEQGMFIAEIRIIWQTYLTKRQQLGLPATGMFKKYVLSRNKQPEKSSAMEKVVEEENEESGENQKEDQKDEQPAKKKRGRKPKSESEKAPKQAVSKITQFRCYYNTSVKPLIAESQQERRDTDDSRLTACQLAFLAYLLAFKDIDEEFLQAVSLKYLRLLFQLWRKPVDSTYIKERYLSFQLGLRNSNLLSKKQESIRFILLIDLLRCWARCQKGDFHQLLDQYERQTEQGDMVRMLKKSIAGQEQEESLQMPAISYQLIYSLIYVAAIRCGICLTVGQLVAASEKLQLKSIELLNQIVLPAVINQESITIPKTRRTAHLLAFFLEIQISCKIVKWCEKWCRKLALSQWQNQIVNINCTLFHQVEFAGKSKLNIYEEILGSGKILKYHRFIELEQDIATLAGIVIFLKLSTGLTAYPYLIQTPAKELAQFYDIKNDQLSPILQLLQTNNLTLRDKSTQNIYTQQLPIIYFKSISLLGLSKRLSDIQRQDKLISRQAISRKVIRLRNLAHLANVSTLDFINRFQWKEGAQDHAQLKYDETAHRQWIREAIEKSKKLKKKLKIQYAKKKASLHSDLLNQLGCIFGSEDEIIPSTGANPIRQCRIDEPSGNYELMYEYACDNLMMVGRQQQLYFMQLLCLNHCQPAEMNSWINRLQSQLRHYEMPH